jgi:hypothetical protein
MAGFTATENMNTPRQRAAAARLSDGRVLVAGGIVDPTGAVTSTETYNPISGRWTPTGLLTHEHHGHAARTLVVPRPGVRAVLVGGDAADTDTLVERWDGATGEWTAATYPPYLRRASAAWLGDAGELVVLCGATPTENARLVAIDLETSELTELASPMLNRDRPQTCRLADGRVLVVGGIRFDGGVERGGRECEVFDPAMEAWSLTGDLVVVHDHPDRVAETLVALPGGDALMVSGPGESAAFTDAVERWSTATGHWTVVAPLPIARDGHTTTILADGTVLVAGGLDDTGARADAYTYAPQLNTWSPADALTVPRAMHEAVLLTDGRILVIGGTPDGSCELFGT